MGSSSTAAFKICGKQIISHTAYVAHQVSDNVKAVGWV